MPPIKRIVTDLGKTAQQVQQGEIGISTVQAIRSYHGWQAWADGQAPATAVLMGPPAKD